LAASVHRDPTNSVFGSAPIAAPILRARCRRNFASRSSLNAKGAFGQSDTQWLGRERYSQSKGTDIVLLKSHLGLEKLRGVKCRSDAEGYFMER
jgi:hypothetical protein